MNQIIAICGMPGAGKSQARTFFEQKGYYYIHLGATEETIKRYGKTTEELERKVRLELRQQYGMAAMLFIKMDEIKEALEQGKHIIIDNMYSWDEYKLLKKEYKNNFVSIAIHASPKIRYKRLLERKHPLREGFGYTITEEICISRDYAEIEEIAKGGPIAMGDYNIVNETTLEHLNESLEKIYQEIKPI